jgi:hypothetical protein
VVEAVPGAASVEDDEVRHLVVLPANLVRANLGGLNDAEPARIVGGRSEPSFEGQRLTIRKPLAVFAPACRIRP